MFQDKYGKTASEFNQKYNIVVCPNQVRFEENLLNYPYNSLLPQFQDLILQDIRAAILTAQKGFINKRVVKQYFKELTNNLKPEYYNSLLLLYKEVLKPQNLNQFYFSGIGSGIKVEKVTWPFQEGFGFCIWLQVENVNYDQFNETNYAVQKIISIHGQSQQSGGGIECYIMRGSIYYRIISTIYQEPQMGNGAVFIGQLKQGSNFIGISHEAPKKFSSAHLTIYFNNEQSKTMTLDYPKLNSNVALTKFYLCENLFGTCSCIIIMNQSSSKIKTIQQMYGPLTIDFKQIKTLPANLDKYFDRIMSIYIPEFAENNHILDAVGTTHAQFLSKSGFIVSDKNRLRNFGGFKLFYSMLHLSGVLYKQINSALLNLSQIFEILNIVLKNNPQLQQEAYISNFFPTIASIILSFEKPLINTRCIELLNETKITIIDTKLMDHFFIYILWNSKLHQKCISEQVFSKLLQLACLVYLQNPLHYNHLISSKDLLDILIFSYPDSQCCEIHFQEQEQSFQLQYFEKILYLFNQQNDLSDHLILFDQYLVSKITPCLLLQILNILKSLLVDNQDTGIKTQTILSKWNQNQIVKSLLFLFKNTSFNDIRSNIIYFLHLIFTQPLGNPQTLQQEAIEFITNSIEPLYDVIKGVNQKLQKSSTFKLQQQDEKDFQQIKQEQPEFDELKNLGTQFLNNDYESVPQAPSMTNRRKPNQGFFDSKQRPPPRAQSIPAPEIEKPKQVSYSVDQKGKKKFHIKIDTEAINALYNFGGEQGKKTEFDHEAFSNELQEIERLAKKCHQYMQGIREKEEVFESPKQSPRNIQTIQQQQQIIRQAPMSTKNAQVKQQFQQPQIQQVQELNSIKEISSSTMSLVQQEPQQQNNKIQSFVQIYNQLLCWMLDKLKAGSVEPIMIEEGDLIKNSSIINTIMKIFQFSKEEQLKAQILQDLLCLTKSHKSNPILMLGQSKFQICLLKQLSEQDNNSLIYEIGSRLHSTLIVYVLKTEFIGGDYIYELLNWNGSQNLIEMQLTLICDQLFDLCKNYQASSESQLWKNIMTAELYLIDVKEKYPQIISKFNKINDLIYKDYQFIGNVQEQMKQISNYFSEPMQQLILRTQSFFNLKIQNQQVFEILLEYTDTETIENLLTTYSLVNEICKSEINYGLIQIIAKMILKDNQNLISSITKLLLIIVVSIEKKQISFLKNFFSEIQEEFDVFLESLLAKSFNQESNVQISQFVNQLSKSNFLVYDFIDIKSIPPQSWQVESLISFQTISRDIQSFGEQKYIEIEEQKTKWIYLECEKERIGRNKYYKSLQSLFLNDNWLASKEFYNFSQRNDIMKDFTEQFPKNELFRYKISKTLTKSLARPYLKLIPFIPQILINKPLLTTPSVAPMLLNNDHDKFETIYTQRQSINSQAVQAATQLLNMGKVLGNNIKNTIKTITQQKGNQQSPDAKSFLDSSFSGKKVIVINGLNIFQAFFSLSHQQLMIQYSQIRNEQSHVSLEPFQLKDHQRLIKVWPIYNIVLIVKKKYLQKRNALEIFFIDGKSLFISVPDPQDLEEIAQKILKFRKTSQAPFFIQNKQTDPIKLLEKLGYMQKWNKQLMSNFKYLLLLNNLASRSYNDLTQYPVFPWVICEIKENQENQQDESQQIRIYPEGQFRAMQKTMGALGNNSRIKSYIERFEAAEQHSDIPPFHYGSHYSSPAITSQYLIRLEPFTSASREIQGGKFDIADRLFYSFIESFRCATEDVADVRELIPEVFSLPEMFLNLSSLDFGKTQGGMQVNNVILPQWANGCPWKFVAGQRNALESEEIQKNLPEWIDLIFGFKQRGKNAEKALNKFFYVTYDNAITLERMEENKLSIETQIVNFGITPLQLFIKPHISRIINPDNQFISQSLELKVYRPPNKKKVPNTMKLIVDLQQASSRSIIKIKWMSDVRLLCLRKEGKIDYLKWTSSIDTVAGQPPFQCGLEKEKQFNFEKPLGDLFNSWDMSASLSSYPILILNQGRLFVCGGYHLGKLVLINDNNQITEIIQLHTSTITAMACDKKESIMITGDKNGHVMTWKIDKSKEYKITAKTQYFDHNGQINCIFVSTSMKLFATGCSNGQIYIYNIYSGALFRSFLHPNRNPINSLILSGRPLYCIIFFSAYDHQIYSYSINGFLLEVQKEECYSMIDCQIIRNNQFQDILIYGTENGELVRRQLPYLQQLKRFVISSKSPVLSISNSKDKKFLICGCNDGDISVLAEPQQNK